MESKAKTSVTVQATINAPLHIIWKKWNSPEDIVRWNYASADWHTPHASNDLRVNGKFFSRMEAKDGSSGFDFEGIYDNVRENELIEYHLEDGRRVKIGFSIQDNGKVTKVVETFDTETENPIEMQREGWQAILDNFKKYVETGK